MGYMGAKSASGTYQAIISQMARHDTYVEPFLGSGVVMKRKPPARRSIGLDLNAEILAEFRCDYEVEVILGDAFAFLEAFDYSAAVAGRVLVYADPPYLASTRSSDARYKYELTENQHRELLQLLKGLPALVMISGYPSALYDSMLVGWRTLEFQAMTRGGPRTEKLWMNFESEGLHWASFAGKDFTDRQRIKRKAERWARRYGALGAGERIAVLSALLEAEGARWSEKGRK